MRQQSTATLSLMLACVAAVFGIQIAACQQQDHTRAKDQKQGQGIDTSTWKTYRNEKYGFEIKHPETWPVRAASGTSPDIIVIGHPVSQGKPTGSLTLIIQENQNLNKLSIEQYFRNQLKLMKTPDSDLSRLGDKPNVSSL